MSASAVFAQETDSTTSEARAETDIIVTGTRVRTPGLTSTSPISAVEGEQISLQRAVTIEDFSVKMPQLAGGVNSTSVGSDAFGAQTLDLRNLGQNRSEEHTSELQSLMRISYAVFCLKKKTNQKPT